MKFSTAATSMGIFLLSTNNNVNAFGPSPSFAFTQHQQQRQTTTTRLSLFPDVILATSAIESASVMTSNAFVDSLGSLALMGSVGFGIAAGMKNKDWNYEYKVGNDAFSGGEDLALLGENPTSVMEKAEESAAKIEPETVVEVADTVAVKAPKPIAPKPAAPAAKPIKANIPSKGVLESAEKAKAQVQKVGVKEMKQKMNSKAGPPKSATPPPAATKEEGEISSTEVVKTKIPGGKRRFAKGVGLILAAGSVAAARNVVKAWLGRGIL